MPLHRFDRKINGLPRQLRFVRVLEEFEGDILVQYQSVGGSGFYVEKWCDVDGDINRFLLVRTELRFIAEYMGKKITLLQLLTNSSDGNGFIVDRRGDEIVSVHAIRFEDLPVSYMPDETAMHDEDLRPNWVQTELNFLLNEEWDATLLGDLEKICQNTYGFAYYTQPGKNRKLPKTVLGYKYDGGYAMGNCFGRVREAMPLNLRTRSVGVAAASPGVLALNTSTEVSKHIRSVLKDISSCSDEFKALHKWSKTKPANASTIPDNAIDSLKNLCEGLEVELSALFPDPTQSIPKPMENKTCILAAGKILASYYRRLLALVRKDKGYDFIGAGSGITVIPEGATVEEETAEEE